MPIAPVPPPILSRASPGAFPPALRMGHPPPLPAVANPSQDLGQRRLVVAVLSASLLALALAFGINFVPHPRSRTQSGISTLQAGQSFAAGTCMACHAIGASARSLAPEPGEAPAFQWIARNHPDYLDGFLLRPGSMHPLVVGQNAAGLRAVFADLARVR